MVDPYFMHRVALVPFLQPIHKTVISEQLFSVSVIGEDTFVNFVARHGLAPLWYDMLTQEGLCGELSDRSLDTLSALRREATIHSQLQRSAHPEIRDVLDSQEIMHATYRRFPTVKPILDASRRDPEAGINVMIPVSDRERAITALVAAGYTLQPKPENASHKAQLQREALTIELQWDALRPGATRKPMTGDLLLHRHDAGDHWVLGHAAALFVALTHPLSASGASRPQSSLIAMLDLSQQLDTNDHIARSTLKLLRRGGLKTAAWMMLRRLKCLSENAASSASLAAKMLQQNTAPGLLRRICLDHCLRNNLWPGLRSAPRLTEFAFTLLAHDTIGDTPHEIRVTK